MATHQNMTPGNYVIVYQIPTTIAVTHRTARFQLPSRRYLKLIQKNKADPFLYFQGIRGWKYHRANRMLYYEVEEEKKTCCCEFETMYVNKRSCWERYHSLEYGIYVVS